MLFTINQVNSIFILSFVVLSASYRIEARPKEVIPVPGWFNNVEGFILPNLKAFQTTEPNYIIIRKHLEIDDELDSTTKKKKRKKRKRIIKKAAKKFKKEEERRKSGENGEKKNKKHKTRGRRLKFIKSDVNEKDLKDSNLSKSKETDSKRKPFDIVVHIKMND